MALVLGLWGSGLPGPPTPHNFGGGGGYNGFTLQLRCHILAMTMVWGSRWGENTFLPSPKDYIGFRV